MSLIDIDKPQSKVQLLSSAQPLYQVPECLEGVQSPNWDPLAP